jgi:hypothetical protein
MVFSPFLFTLSGCAYLHLYFIANKNYLLANKCVYLHFFTLCILVPIRLNKREPLFTPSLSLLLSLGNAKESKYNKV